MTRRDKPDPQLPQDTHCWNCGKAYHKPQEEVDSLASVYAAMRIPPLIISTLAIRDKYFCTDCREAIRTEKSQSERKPGSISVGWSCAMRVVSIRDRLLKLPADHPRRKEMFL